MRLAPRAALLAAVIGIPLGMVGLAYALTDEAPAPSIPAEVRIEGPMEPEVRQGTVQPTQSPAPFEVVAPPPPIAVTDDDDDDNLDDDDDFDDDDDGVGDFDDDDDDDD
ncbi:MAG: hypothetical protein ACRDS9_23400 [Pseudonocardiaceae bacterium]